MTTNKVPRTLLFEKNEDQSSNTSDNPTIGDVIDERFTRRSVMSGLLGTTAIASFTSPMALLGGCSAEPSTTPSFQFQELHSSPDDNHHVADGYNADVLIRWGDKVMPEAPEFDPEAQTPASQASQFGYNNDFVGFIPLDGRSDHGLLVVNHEYTNEELMFKGLGPQNRGHKRFADMTRELVEIEMNAHGGSVIEIKRKNGKWSVIENSPFARRITANSPMKISGPAAGNQHIKTTADPDGTNVIGMINNCAGATTPWGTWLTCEENFNGYFWNKGAATRSPNAGNLKRYGIPVERYCWGKYFDRFNLGKETNEPNRFGWVVEIDPKDPTSTPIKRTALGRFKHEGAGNIINRDGRFVVYQGDDQRFEYIYRFVTRNKIDKKNPEKNKNILDEGTLYVARFNADGSGIWLPLEFGQGPLTKASGFKNQGDVLIHTRLAADLLGATKMDRPEDIEANTKTGKVYVMLTNNTERTQDNTDPANPRADNKFGHIIELNPDGGDHTGPTFRWDILVKCGDPEIAQVGATFNPSTSKTGWFANPDNCVIDAKGRLWIATDGNTSKKTGRTDGVWAMETTGKARGTSKLFFSCPKGAEMCGPAFTPDLETFFIAVQHPGQSEDGVLSTYNNPSTRWPDFKHTMPPRPAIVVITKKGGGKIAL